MGSDPVPQDPARCLDADGTAGVAHPDGPVPSDLLEVQRRMPGVRLQDAEVLVGQLLDVLRQPAVVLPEVGVGMITHSSEQRPCARSLRA